jgi:hypothetical protein
VATERSFQTLVTRFQFTRLGKLWPATRWQLQKMSKTVERQQKKNKTECSAPQTQKPATTCPVPTLSNTIQLPVKAQGDSCCGLQQLHMEVSPTREANSRSPSQIFHRVYRNGRLTTLLTRARHWSPSWARWIQSTHARALQHSHNWVKLVIKVCFMCAGT